MDLTSQRAFVTAEPDATFTRLSAGVLPHADADSTLEAGHDGYADLIIKGGSVAVVNGAIAYREAAYTGSSTGIVCT